ncbi:gas vesicle protein [Actinomadura sp. HBU206391]|nr:gas vesicle protein [Actinomadura sp. HBU206391]
MEPPERPEPRETPKPREPPAPEDRGEREETAARERGPAPRRGRRVTAALAARSAARHVGEMTGKEPEGITSLEHTDDGRWRIGVEVVEIHRIPDTTDILALYEAELDECGELIAYRRTQRYARAQTLED